MRQALVAGNWKMNGTRAQAAALVDGILAGIDSVANVEIVLCPPFIYLPLLAQKVNRQSGIAYGGQNLDSHASGAYTGEISGPMLADIGCRYVIVGHSERRALFGESDEIVMHKCRAAQECNLIPILCIGETLRDRESGRAEAVIEAQLDAVSTELGVGALDRMVLAYEPVWAIGTGRTATPEQAQQAHRFLREQVEAVDARVAAGMRILYGGSVKAANARELFSQPDIDGGLIGGASLESQEFLNICKAAV